MSLERKGIQVDAGRMAAVVLKGSGTGIVVSVLVLLIAAGLICVGTVREENAGVLALLAAFVGSFAGGLFSGLILKSRVLFVGISVGVIELIVWCLVGLVPAVNGEGELVGLACVCLLGGVLSGLLSANGKKRRR